MVLNYKGAPPFKKPVQTLTPTGYAYPAASESTLRQIQQVFWRLDINNEDSVRELMSVTGLVENVDWWLVKWTDEGLSDPGTGNDYVVKVKVPAGGSVRITVKLLYSGYGQNLYIRAYIPSSVELYMQRSSNSYADVTYPANGENYSTRTVGADDWKDYSYYTASSHSRVQFVIIKLTNTSSSDEYVYIGELSLFVVDIGTYWKGIFLNNERDDIAGTTWDQNYILYTHRKAFKIWITITAVSDGTNPVTVTVYVYDIRVGWKQIWSGSTTSSTGTTWYVRAVIKQLLQGGSNWYAFWVRIVVDASSATSAKASYSVTWVPTFDDAEIDKYYKRVSGSYTSDGNGTTDTVTILDYTTGTKHIGKLLRVKATGDANTTLLQLQVDGNVVWDFLNDGDTCTLDIEDVQKVELLVNDNGSATTTSTTTVNYVVQYVEEDSVIFR